MKISLFTTEQIKRFLPLEEQDNDLFCAQLELYVNSGNNGKNRVIRELDMLHPSEVDFFRTVHVPANCRLFRMRTEKSVRTGIHPLCMVNFEKGTLQWIGTSRDDEQVVWMQPYKIRYLYITEDVMSEFLPCIE